jgi:hypothetical protein
MQQLAPGGKGINGRHIHQPAGPELKSQAHVRRDAARRRRHAQRYPDPATDAGVSASGNLGFATPGTRSCGVRLTAVTLNQTDRDCDMM